MNNSIPYNATRFWAAALAASIIFHITALYCFNRYDWFEITLENNLSPGPVTLEFVDSPDRIARLDTAVEETNLISNQDSRAQDVIPDHPEDEKDPRSEGSTRIRSIRKVPKSSQSSQSRGGTRGEDEKVSQDEGSIISQVGGEESSRTDSPSIEAGKLPLELSGADEFLSPEADNPGGKARILKQVAYNTRSTEVGRYLSRLKPRVSNLWMLVVMNNTYYVRSKNTSILFKINPDGFLDQVMMNEHNGPAWEVRYALKAIVQAAPYEPLSREILDHIQDDGLWLEFNFNYE